jgi:hypothetical protein
MAIPFSYSKGKFSLILGALLQQLASSTYPAATVQIHDKSLAKNPFNTVARQMSSGDDAPDVASMAVPSFSGDGRLGSLKDDGGVKDELQRTPQENLQRKDWTSYANRTFPGATLDDFVTMTSSNGAERPAMRNMLNVSKGDQVWSEDGGAIEKGLQAMMEIDPSKSMRSEPELSLMSSALVLSPHDLDSSQAFTHGIRSVKYENTNTEEFKSVHLCPRRCTSRRIMRVVHETAALAWTGISCSKRGPRLLLLLALAQAVDSFSTPLPSQHLGDTLKAPDDPTSASLAVSMADRVGETGYSSILPPSTTYHPVLLEEATDLESASFASVEDAASSDSEGTLTLSARNETSEDSALTTKKTKFALLKEAIVSALSTAKIDETPSTSVDGKDRQHQTDSGVALSSDVLSNSPRDNSQEPSPTTFIAGNMVYLHAARSLAAPSTSNSCYSLTDADYCGSYAYTYSTKYSYTYSYTYSYRYSYTYSYTYGYSVSYTYAYTAYYTYSYTYYVSYSYTYYYTCYYSYSYSCYTGYSSYRCGCSHYHYCCCTCYTAHYGTCYGTRSTSCSGTGYGSRAVTGYGRGSYTAYGTSYGTRYATGYGTRYATGYGTSYGTAYATKYSTAYAADTCDVCYCAAGYYSSPDGIAASTGSCSSCPSGQFSIGNGTTACTSCPGGQYQDSSAETSCKTCPGVSISLNEHWYN